MKRWMMRACWMLPAATVALSAGASCQLKTYELPVRMVAHRPITSVKLNGTEVPAGTYELFTIPGKTEWTVIIHKNMSQWGAYSYDAKNDVARVQAKPVTGSYTLTITLKDNLGQTTTGTVAVKITAS